MSSLILSPQAENQTIFTRSSSYNDNGNYTCVLTNDTDRITHTIELNVQGKTSINTKKKKIIYIEFQLYLEYIFVCKKRFTDFSFHFNFRFFQFK